MKIKHLLAGIGLVAAIAAPTIAPAGAAATVRLTVVDGYQYSVDSLMEHLVCLDDIEVKSDDAILTTIDIVPGDYTLTVSSDPAATCDDDASDWFTADVTVSDAAYQSLAFGWPDLYEAYARSIRGTLPTWSEDSSFGCAQAGHGRVVFRNYVSAPNTPVSFGRVSGDDLSTFEALIGDVPNGGQADVEAPDGPYPDTASGYLAVGITPWDPAVALFDDLAISGQSTSIVYAVGGNDGQIGLVSESVPSDCDPEEPTTTDPGQPTTSVAVRPVATAPAAVAVSARPAYTG